MSHFIDYYKTIIVQDLINKFNYKTHSNLPFVKKITLNIGWKQYEIKNLLPSLLAIELIISQKAILTNIKKLDISIKMKKGLPTGCKVTLRYNQAYEFIFNLINEIFPKLNQFSGFKIKNNMKSISFSLLEILTFSELETNYLYFKKISKLDITIKIKANHFNEIYFLLKSLKFPLKLANTQLANVTQR